MVKAAIPAAALFRLTSRPDLATLIFTECGSKLLKQPVKGPNVYQYYLRTEIDSLKHKFSNGSLLIRLQ